MKITTLLTIIPLSLLSISAMAGMGSTKGDTTCIVISSIAKAKTHGMPCSYTADVGASMSYSIEHMNYKLATGTKYSTINDATFDFGKDGKVKNLVEEISLNGKPAKLKNLIDGTYKEISEADLNARYNKEISEADLDARYNKEPVDLTDILKCFIPDAKKDTAFCVPFFEEGEEDGMS